MHILLRRKGPCAVAIGQNNNNIIEIHKPTVETEQPCPVFLYLTYCDAEQKSTMTMVTSREHYGSKRNIGNIQFASESCKLLIPILIFRIWPYSVF